MFQIGEFSKITQVSVRMLRYYDEQDLLHPALVDEDSGYRMYIASQIEELNKIIRLRDMGMGVKEIKDILSQNNSLEIKDLLKNKLQQTREEARLLQDRMKYIKSYMDDMDAPEKTTKMQIVLKKLPAVTVFSYRKVVKDYYCEGEMWEEFTELASRFEGRPCFTLYHDVDFRDENVDIEICIEMDEQSLQKVSKKDLGKQPNGAVTALRKIDEVPLAASFMVYGPYSNIAIAYKEFAYWLENHEGYKMAGENRQVCHVNYQNVKSEDELVTEQLIPLCR